MKYFGQEGGSDGGGSGDTNPDMFICAIITFSLSSTSNQ